MTACTQRVNLMVRRFAASLALAVSVLHGSAVPTRGDDKSDSSASPEPPQAKLGLNLNDPRAFQGYTLLSPLGATMTYLLDMEGRVVRTWDCGCTPMSSYMLENGNLLRFGKLPPEEQKFGNMPGEAGRIQEFTFDGELVWEYRFGDENRLPHHDIHRMPNGNILMIAWERKSRDDVIAAGRAPGSIGEKGLIPCYLMEIKPTGKNGGELVWEWHVWDHLIQDQDPSKANYGNVAEHPELIDLNFGQEEIVPPKDKAAANQLAGLGYVGTPAQNTAPPMFPDRDWTHFNGIDYNAELDQIVISVHGFSEFWIIDHSTNSEEASGHKGGRSGMGGDLLYRWGNPIAYRAGAKEDQRLFAQHNAQWIPKGLPGEGHILLFNNRHEDKEAKWSSVDELALPVDEQGNYQRPTGEAFGPKEAVWSYTAPKKTEFYSNFISGTQRLANGNTLICSGAHGILFEVTPEKEIVWKYINPTKESPFGGPGGPGGPGPNLVGPPPIGKLLPPFAIDMLKLSDEQKKQLEEIEKEARAKFQQTLNDDQRKQFADLQRGPGPGPPGGGGPNFGPPGRGGPNFGPPRATGGGPPGPPAGPPGVPPDLMAGPPGGTPVFRAYRYSSDYAGFNGKDLTPGKTLVEIVDEAEKAKQAPGKVDKDDSKNATGEADVAT